MTIFVSVLVQQEHEAWRVAAEKAAFDRDGPVPGPGPSDILMPGRPPATAYRRPYLEPGHAAPSPGQGPPNEAPGGWVAPPGTVTTQDPGALPAHIPHVDATQHGAIGWEIRAIAPERPGR